jgi:hypothetical protein
MCTVNRNIVKGSVFKSIYRCITFSIPRETKNTENCKQVAFEEGDVNEILGVCSNLLLNMPCQCCQNPPVVLS